MSGVKSRRWRNGGWAWCQVDGDFLERRGAGVFRAQSGGGQGLGFGEIGGGAAEWNVVGDDLEAVYRARDAVVGATVEIDRCAVGEAQPHYVDGVKKITWRPPNTPR